MMLGWAMGLVGCIGGSDEPQSLLDREIEATECEEATDCNVDRIPACQVPSCVAGQCVLLNAEEGSICNNTSDTCAPGRCDALGTCNRTLDDSLCDNGIFCDGREECQPQDPSADARGCVAGSPRVLEDEVECTVGRCDEEQDLIVQDCSACACCGDATAACGGAPSCFEWTCSANHSCVLEPLGTGAACDDGALCTIGDTCDANQICIGEEVAAFCDDGIYCNGTESCGPGAQNADENGCVQEPRRLDDGLECTVDTCEEERQVVLHDTSACACVSDQDCQLPCSMGTCDLTDNRCIITPLEEGAPCDDGIACTTNERCTAERSCVGEPTDTSCAPDGCTEALQCNPSSPSAGEDGCIRLPESICMDDSGPVLWLDAFTELEQTVEQQSNNLLGDGQLSESESDLEIARSTSANPRPGELFIYDVAFKGEYSTPPTVMLERDSASNSAGNTFEVATRNITAEGFEMVIYRTDQEGARFGTGPDPVSWSTAESLLVRTWPDRSNQAFDAVQDNIAHRPTVLEEEGRRLIRFRDDWLDFTRPIAGDFTIVMVFRSFDGRDTGRWWSCPVLLGGELEGNARDMALTLCNGQVGWGADDTGFDVLTENPGEYNDGQLHLLVLTRSQATGILNLRMDREPRLQGMGVN
ncbi:MAG: hypothetical protein AAFX99_04720, partial [Myxococcota bacterium]